MTLSTQFTTKFIAACAIFYWSSSAFSHITLEQTSVETSATTKATLRIGHGCQGLPTQALRVQIPQGFAGTKPMPKAGWSVVVQRAKLTTPYDDHGKQITDDVNEVTWTANTREAYITEEQYDEFVLRGKAPGTAGHLWFKVTQFCKDGDKIGQNLWTEIPASGTSVKGLKFPAALLNVINSATHGTPTVPAANALEHKH
jgi:periplasmic copper chaperone A